VLATPLLLVLVLVEWSDLVFAIDSIPAIFAVTRDPFLVYSSNIFAILGLRALFFVLAGMLDKFVYLETWRRIHPGLRWSKDDAECLGAYPDPSVARRHLDHPHGGGGAVPSARVPGRRALQLPSKDRAGERYSRLANSSLLSRLGLDRPELRAWAMYDWAASAMQTTVMVAVFPIYS